MKMEEPRKDVFLRLFLPQDVVMEWGKRAYP